VELWQSLSPEEHYTRERQWLKAHGQDRGPKPKPGNYIATGEELKTLEGKTPTEQLTFVRERALQAQRQRP
jgi:hypothetical protein